MSSATATARRKAGSAGRPAALRFSRWRVAGGAALGVVLWVRGKRLNTRQKLPKPLERHGLDCRDHWIDLIGIRAGVGERFAG